MNPQHLNQQTMNMLHMMSNANQLSNAMYLNGSMPAFVVLNSGLQQLPQGQMQQVRAGDAQLAFAARGQPCHPVCCAPCRCGTRCSPSS